MSAYPVQTLMVPLSEYATVRVGATLYEAVSALEQAELAYDHSPYCHRALLVLDPDDKVVGKVSHRDVLRAIEIEPESRETIPSRELERYGFSPRMIRSIVDQRRRKDLSLQDLCQKATRIRAETIMHAPTEGDYIDERAPLELAIHQLVEGAHLSLLVTRGTDIVGVLRLSDAFAAVFHTMKECQLDNR